MIDWPKYTGKLRMKYGSLSNLSRQTDLNIDTIRHLNRGEILNPRFSVGLKIINLYLAEYPDEQSQVLAAVENAVWGVNTNNWKTND